MYEGPVQDLIDELGRLPGIGPKSAQRLAFHLLTADGADITRLQTALQRVKDEVRFCTECGNVAEAELCRICSDPRRDASVICVVEEPKGRAGDRADPGVPRSVSRAGRRDLADRRHRTGPAAHRPTAAADRRTGVGEVILATDPNLEGEATATYLIRMLRTFPDLSVTRLASGLPVGGDLEYADEVTLGRAFSGRRSVDS